MRAWWTLFAPKMVVQLRSKDQKVLEDWTGYTYPPPRAGEHRQAKGCPRDSPWPQYRCSRDRHPSHSRAVLPHKSRTSSRVLPVVYTEGSPGASDNPEATYQRLTEELLERLRCSEAADVMKGSLSRFYRYYKQELKGPQPGIWNE